MNRFLVVALIALSTILLCGSYYLPHSRKHHAVSAGDGLSGDWFTCDFSGSGTSWTTEGVCGGTEEFDSVENASSLSIVSNAGTANPPGWDNALGIRAWTNASTNTIYIKFKFSVDDPTLLNEEDILLLYDETTYYAGILLNTSGNLVAYCERNYSCGTSTTALSADTDYWISLFVQAQNGSSELMKLWISTDSTITSGDLEVDYDGNGFDGTRYPDEIRIGGKNGDGSSYYTTTWDDLEVDDDTTYEE